MQISSLIRSGCDQRILALVILARSLWLQGYADRAVTTATQALGRANALDHPVSLCVCSMVAVTVFLWTGDWSEADTSIDRLIAHSKEHSLGPYHVIGFGLKGKLSFQRGDTEAACGY
jgi:hypothetical protein